MVQNTLTKLIKIKFKKQINSTFKKIIILKVSMLNQRNKNYQ